MKTSFLEGQNIIFEVFSIVAFFGVITIFWDIAEV